MNPSPSKGGRGPDNAGTLEAQLLQLHLGDQAPRAPDGADDDRHSEHDVDDSSSSSSDRSAGHPDELHPDDGARSGPPETKAPTAALPSDARVGFLYDQSMEQHSGPEDHVERPSRVIAVHARLAEEGLLGRTWHLPPRKATDEELLLAHSAQHIRQIDTMFARRYPERTLDLRDAAYCFADNSLGDVYVCKGTAGAARMAAGCVVQAVRSVLSGAVQRCLAVVRPPGHHAECERAQGFCFFNNVAVAALSALKEPGVKRVAVLDWDVHHGNGIQEILYDRPDVLYVSLHRDPKHFYPYYAGFVGEAGHGAGLGFNVNIPWAKKGMGDGDYMAAFKLIVEPILSSYDPDLVIVAAGYDAAEGDPLGGCKLTPEGYAWMTERLMQFAGGKLVLALEGGYNNRVTAACVAACMRALLAGAASPPLPLDREHCWPSECHNSLKTVYELQQQYWPALAQRGWAPAWEAHAKYIVDLMGSAHSRPKRGTSGAAAATSLGSCASGAAAVILSSSRATANRPAADSRPASAAGGGGAAGDGSGGPAAAPGAAAPTLQEAFLARKAAREAAAAAVSAVAASYGAAAAAADAAEDAEPPMAHRSPPSAAAAEPAASAASSVVAATAVQPAECSDALSPVPAAAAASAVEDQGIRTGAAAAAEAASAAGTRL